MPDPGDLPVRATTSGRVAGNDLLEATRVLRGELGSPHLVPLASSDALVGTTAFARTATQLRELTVALSPHGWRLTGSRAGDDHAARQARSHHATLLGITADVIGAEPAGPTSLSIVGPATLAARLALPGGEPALADRGAVRDLSAAWVEAMAGLARSAQASLPGSAIVLDVAEPDFAAVTSGLVRSSSGYRVLKPWDRADVGAAWAALAGRCRCILPVEAAAMSAMPSAEDPTDGDEPDLEQDELSLSPAARIAVRIPAQSEPGGYEPVAGWVESGRDVVVGVPHRSAFSGPGKISDLAQTLTRPWRQLGLSNAELSHVIVETNTAGVSLDPLSLGRSAIRARGLAEAVDAVRHDDLP